MRPRVWKTAALTLLVALSAAPAWAQAGPVTGRVTDAASGDPLPVVTVRVKGTTVGASTDLDGEYQVVAAARDTLVFSFVGYVTQEVAVAGRSVVDVALAPDVAALDDVVVVAYGEASRANATGAITQIDEAELAELPVPGLDQAIAGRSPGVQVLQSSGVPGGGPEIIVRGLGTISGANGPLIVVDGVPVGYADPNLNNPLNSIPPDDIQSVTVLRDAASTALYGSRASGGVLLVTTKQGRAGRPQISFSSRVGGQSVPSWEVPELLDAQEYVQFRKESVIDGELQPRFFAANGRYATAEEAERWFFGETVGGVANNPNPATVDALGDPASYGAGTDWFDEVTQSAPIREYNLSLRGGSPSVRYFVSGSVLDQGGVVRATGFDRYSFRSNVDADITSRLRFSLDLSPSRTVQERSPTDPGPQTFAVGGVLMRARLASPVAPAFDAEGRPTLSTRVPGAIAGFYQANPIRVADDLSDQQTNDRVLLSSALEFEPLDGLRLRTSLGADGRSVTRETFSPSTVNGDLLINPNNGYDLVDPSGSVIDQEFFTLLSENTVAYDRTLRQRHTVGLLGGFTFQEDTFTQSVLTGGGYPNEDDRRIQNAEVVDGSNDRGGNTLVSWLGRATYDFDDRYLLTAAVRADGSSRFGADDRWGVFPSASVGWRVSEEPFFSVPAVSQLKLKAGYGVTGNYGIGNYAALGRIGQRNYVFGDVLAPGRAVGSLTNSRISWEQTEQADAGLEVGLWGDRLYLVADVYRSTTTDLLSGIDFPAISGFGGVLGNIGSIRNQGVELAVTARPVQRALTWEVQANVSVNRNEVLELNNADFFYSGGAANGTPFTISRVGEPLGQFIGLQLDGLYTQADIDDPDVPKYPGAGVGAPKFVDGDGDGVLETLDDYVVLGDPEPDFSFGFTNTLGWRGLDLRVVAVGAVGGEIFDLQREITQNLDGVFNVGREVLDRWRPGEDPAAFTVPGTVSFQGRRRWRFPNSEFVKDGTYLSVRNVTLGYTLPARVVQAAPGLRSGRVYLSVQNALLFSGFDGNPEVRKALDSPIIRGVNYGSYPTARTVTVGVSVGL